DGGVPRALAALPGDGSGASPPPLRDGALASVLGHERVRALRRPALLVRALLGGGGAGAGGGGPPLLGPGDSADLPRAAARGAGAAGPAVRSAARGGTCGRRRGGGRAPS